MRANSKVTLLGAGPGDPELISVKGLKAIQSADVILYDALVHPDLVAMKRAGCEAIYAGKRANNHRFPQEKINQLLVDYALTHGHVVRLKGGDPFVFARGKEELEHVETFDIPTEVIPGISSVNLSGVYGIPLTVRGINESYWVVTATTSSGALSEDVGLVAQSSATAVILMGLGKLEKIVKQFMLNGKYDTPVAIISNGSLPHAKVIYGRVDGIIEQKRLSRIETPAIIVIGEAVGTHPNFYEKVKVALDKTETSFAI
ncbi:MAG: uroporphyrinogen-III C-methyltransferase [Bacteroidota bacterium]